MKHFLTSVVIFTVVFLVYFLVGTNYALKPKWAIDYFNQIAQSILHFRLDILHPGTTYDLSYYGGKWYGPWGIIPALILIPLQIIKGQFVPTFYLSIFFSSLNVVFMYLLLLRIKREFLQKISTFDICIFLILFAFGTTQFYVGTLGSVWHVDQITTSFLGTLGIFVIFRKKRKFIHYLGSITCFSLALLGRPTLVLLTVLPMTLYVLDLKRKKTLREVLLLSTPLLFFSILFFFYNYLRFNNIFEYGFSYIHESPYLQQIRERNGAFSIKNIPQNLWYMLFEIPHVNFSNKNFFNFNLNGNSLLFLTPPLIAAFLASPIIRKGRKFIFDSYIAPLWITVFVTLIPSWMHYGSGWIQFGYRFALDVNVLLVLLSIFGIKGKVGPIYLIGTIFAIVIYIIGIHSFM